MFTYVYIICLYIPKLARLIESKKEISVKTYIQIAKALLLLYGTMQLIAILSLYNGLGWSSVLFGGVAIFIASNDSLIKSSGTIIISINYNSVFFLYAQYNKDLCIYHWYKTIKMNPTYIIYVFVCLYP